MAEMDTRSVSTTSGPIDRDELGVTLMHEHVAIFSAATFNGMPFLYDRSRILNRCVEHLEQARRAGIGTIVDVTTVDLGRDIDLVAEAARRSGVNVVVATGFWLDVPRYFRVRSPDDAAAAFTREIEVGIGYSHVRAGVIKVASDEETAGFQERILRGAARASIATGAAITTHAPASTRSGLRQLEVLADEGVPLDRVVIGHSGGSDRQYLAELYKAGCSVGWDTFAIQSLSEADLASLCEFISTGYAAQTILSNDHSPFNDWGSEAGTYATVMQDVLPRLRRAGIGESSIRQILVSNPSRLLTSRTRR